MRPLALLLPGLVAVACTATEPATPPIDPMAADKVDLIKRIAEAQDAGRTESPTLLLNSLERMLPAWQSEQRRGRAEPLENLLTQKVVVNFDTLVETFHDGPHERRLVAAWALGFSRVPVNELGVRSRHIEARQLLLDALERSSDDVAANIMLALWRLGDADTPLDPLTDVVVNHHDATVRANAVLALTTVLDEARAERVLDAVLVALEDTEPKVRLHAASVARRFPHPASTTRIESLLETESTPLVKASMAAALGAAGQTSSAPALLPLLTSPREIVATSARRALAAIFGEDRGPRPDHWQGLVR